MSAATSTIIGIGAAAASVAGGVIASHGASKAADATLQASREANVENKRQFDISQKNQAPYLGGGAAALGRLDYLLGLNPVIGDSTRSFNQNFGPMGADPTLRSTTTTLTPAQRLQRLSGGGTAGAGGKGAMVSGTQGRQFSESPIPMQDPTQFHDNNLDTGGFHATPPAPPTVGSQGGLVPPASTTSSAVASGPSDPNSYGSLMHDFSAADFQADPGYAFRLSEGQKALERSAAARGVLGSGTFLKDLTDYNQQSGSQEYGNAYNRFQNNRTTRYNFLSNAAGGGQVAANQLGQLGADYARTYGANLMAGAGQAANLRASGYAALGGTIAGALPTGLAAYDYYKYPPPSYHN